MSWNIADRKDDLYLCDYVDANGCDAEEVTVVIDAQTDFVDGILGAKEAVETVGAIAEEVMRADGMVIGTLDTHHDDYMGTQEGQNLPVPHCIQGTDGWMPHPVIRRAFEKRFERTGLVVPMYEKPTFGSIAMARQLAELDARHPIRRIRFLGYCTDICVISNALLVKATLPEVEIVCEAWGCAGVTPEAHDAALRVMGSCQVKVNLERTGDGNGNK